MFIGLGLLRAIQRQRRHQLLALSHAAVRSRLQVAYQQDNILALTQTPGSQKSCGRDRSLIS